MIRLVTLGEFPSEVLEHVARRLHAAYGMGCEIEGQAELPDAALADDQETYQAPKLLEEIDVQVGRNRRLQDAARGGPAR